MQMEPSEIKAMQDYRETEQLAGGTLEMEMFRVAIAQAEAAEPVSMFVGSLLFEDAGDYLLDMYPAS